MTHRICAGVIVEHDQRLLMIRHVRPGRYDLWVAPAGEARGGEPLRETARREASEQTGLDVEVREVMYIEELHDDGERVCIFWFAGWLLGGTLAGGPSGASAETAVEVSWLNAAELINRTVCPPVLAGPYWTDRLQKPRAAIHLAMPRRMEFRIPPAP